MSVSQPPSDTPFGLQPNVAAGIAYVFPLIGGIIMMVGGGTNAFVKWAAAQSIMWTVCYIVVQIAITVLNMITGLHLALIFMLLSFLVWIAAFGIWLWTTITAFQGKSVRIPFVADITTNVFKTAPAA